MSRLPGYLVLLAASFLFTGVVDRVKAWWAGRHGAPLLQEVFDLRKLVRKGEVISRTTSFVFRLNPPVQVAAVVFAALLVPLPGQSSLLHFPGDFVLFAYAFGLAKFMAVIAALDTGSSFEGMGASREAAFSTLVEPAFFILLGSLALITEPDLVRGHLRPAWTTASAAPSWSSPWPPCRSSSCSWWKAPADRSTIPTTHLELTMIHEVMILDYSGPDLAFLLYAAGLKMVLLRRC